GRFGRVDMTLTFFEALALFSFFWWIGPKPTQTPSFVQETVSEPLQYVFALALGLAVLAKGPVGAAIPLISIGIFLVLEMRIAESIRRISPVAVLLAIVLGLSWYIVLWIGRRYGFLERQLGAENLGRFFGALGTMSPLYYLGPLLLNSLPFSLLAPVAVFM